MRNSPPGTGNRSSGVIGYLLLARRPVLPFRALRDHLEDRELELAIVGVDAVEDHAHLVADRKFAAGALSPHPSHVLLVCVLIARPRIDLAQALAVKAGGVYSEDR